MIFQEFITPDMLKAAADALNIKTEEVQVTRLNSLELPPITAIKIIKAINVGSMPYIAFAPMHSKDYKISYGMRLCEMEASDRKEPIRYCLQTQYSSQYGEIVVLFTKQGYVGRADVFRIRRTFIKARRAEQQEVKEPILDKEMLHNLRKNTINFLIKAKKRKLAINRGILIHGEPGNGKSLFGDYIRKVGQNHGFESHVISAPEIAQGSKNLAASYKSINFFDDIDISLMNRKTGGATASDLLSSISGVVKGGPPRCFIFTTNETINSMEAAFIRSGRIDLVVEFKKPTKELRHRLITEMFNPTILKQIQKEASLDWLVDVTDGLTFADVVGINDLMLIHEFNEENINTEDAVEIWFNNNERKADFLIQKKRLGF